MNKYALSLKRILLRSVALASLLLALAGCQQPDSGLLPAVTARKGIRMKTSLSVLPARDPNATKSVYAGDEAVVYNWNLLIFENGVLKAKHYKNAGSDISFQIMTDRAYQYYALANVGDITSRVTEGVTREQEMTSLWVDVSVGNGLPMAWKSPSEIAFSKLQLSQGAKLSVPFTRLVGRYDIVIDKSGLSAWSFTATQLFLKGVSRVQPFSTGSRATSGAVKTDEATAGDLTLLNGGQAAHFYPVENCYGNLLPSGTDPWNKIPGKLAADAFPSYIEIQGKAQMTDGSRLERDVTYRFYLGENASNNFDVERNVTHTVTLVLSDAAIAANNSHWKVETGSYTDSRALAFTHESIVLPSGQSVEEPVIRTPSSLQYRIEMDQHLKEAGVAVAGYQWGDPCGADRLTFTAPEGLRLMTGEVRLKTLDGAKSAAAALTVGKQLRSLRIGLWPSQTEERFHSDTTVVLNQYYVFFWAHVYACYTDGTMKDVTADVVAHSAYTYQSSDFYNYSSSDPGKFGCTPYVGTCVLGASYTEDGITCTACASITRLHGPLASITISPSGSETLLTGERTYPYTLKARYRYTNGEFDIQPDDAVWTFDDPEALEYAGGGMVRTKYKRVYETGFKVSYTEGGITANCYKSGINVFSNLTRISVSPAEVYLINDDLDPEAPAGRTGQYARSTSHTFEVRAYYDDGTSDDITTLPYGIGETEWTDNLPLKYWKDSYWHAVNAYYVSGGVVDFWRYKCKENNWVEQRMAPYWADEAYTWEMMDIKTILRESDPQAILFRVAYTHNGVTALAYVMGTLTNELSQPQRIVISPDPVNAFTGGKTVQFEATCHYENGAKENVTTKASWSASGLATSQGNGRFTTGSEAGTTQVQASFSAKGVTVTGSASLTLKTPAVTSVGLEMEQGSDWVSGSQTVQLGTNQRWRVIVRYEDGTSVARYDGFTLTSSVPSVVAVNGTATQAAAVGSSTVRAQYAGRTSDGVSLTVTNHHYSYDLVVQPADVTMDWNETLFFYAWYRRFDNGVLDTSFGTDGYQDVSSSASWEVDGSLLGVASWNRSQQKLTANNTTTVAVMGTITATYASLEAAAWVKINSSFVPSLTAEPTLLSWSGDASGASAGQSLVIRSNTEWKITGGDAHWFLSATTGSGNTTLTVYPLDRNEGTSDRICTLKLSASGVSNVTVILKHEGTSPQPQTLRYKVVTTVGRPSLPVGEHTTASSVLLSSSDDGASYSTTVSTIASSFRNVLSGEHVSVSGNGITGVSAGNAAIRGVFDGYDVSIYEDAEVTVTSVAEKTLSVQPASLFWTGTEYGLSSAKSVSVSSNVNWSVSSCSAGFSYEVTGTTVRVWPDASNSSLTASKEGSLVLGGPGVANVSVALSQDCRVRQLTGIAFDRAAYDLVRITQDTLTYQQTFTLTASYDDGSSEDVTALASYQDQGALIVARSAGVLRATQTSSGKQLNASYGGKTAVAAYSAAAMECPLSLTPGRMESQNDKSRNFLVTNILLEYCRAFESGTLERDVTGTVTCYPSALIVREGYDEAVGQMFHFTAEGEGSIRFVYTLNGKSVEWLLNLSCNSSGRVSKR